MGKMGKLLREQKKKTTTYTFTAEQLEAHDKLVLQEHLEHLRSQIKPTVDKYVAEEREQSMKVIQEEWDNRAQEFQQNGISDNFLNLLQYLLAVPSRVLIEHFGWRPIPKDGKYDRRNRTMRFADLVADEIGKISHDEMMDVRRYSDETYKLYGVRFDAKEEPDT